MHIILKNQRESGESILCLERGAEHAEVIRCTDPAHVQQMVRVAQSIGAPSIYVIVGAAEVGEWESEGWRRTNAVVMAKDFSNGT